MGERFIVIFDKGWKLSHAMHMRKIKRLISTLQDHYPERLEAAILMRARHLRLRMVGDQGLHRPCHGSEGALCDVE